MQTCTICQTQSPDSALVCPKCHADLSEWSATSVALKSYIENPRVKYIHVMVMGDCCPACQEAGKAYEKDKAPRLPIEGCSHGLGCRCFYQPFLIEIYP